jgi:hypothetical protein
MPSDGPATPAKAAAMSFCRDQDRGHVVLHRLCTVYRIGHTARMTFDFTATGWVAVYSPNKQDPVAFRPVEAWGADGSPLVASDKGLVAASTFTTFLRLDQVRRVHSVIPAAPGWTLRIWNDNDDDGSTFDEPITAWIADTSGGLHPVAASNDSYLEPVGPHQKSMILAPDRDVPPESPV